MESSNVPDPEKLEPMEEPTTIAVDDGAVLDIEDNNTEVLIADNSANSKSIDVQKEIRPWLARLSPKERALALGFTDGPMIAALLELSRRNPLSTSSLFLSNKQADDVQTQGSSNG
jgi:hypothetical protein